MCGIWRYRCKSITTMWSPVLYPILCLALLFSQGFWIFPKDLHVGNIIGPISCLPYFVLVSCIFVILFHDSTYKLGWNSYIFHVHCMITQYTEMYFQYNFGWATNQNSTNMFWYFLFSLKNDTSTCTVWIGLTVAVN